MTPPNNKIAPALLRNVGNSGSEYTTPLGIAAIVADTLNEEDTFLGKPKIDPSAIPKGWHWVGYDGQPIVAGKEPPTRIGFGPASEKQQFSFLIPDGFEVINITHNADNGKNGPSSGYDAVALYNPNNGELIIVNHGADSGSDKDKAAVLADGGTLTDPVHGNANQKGGATFGPGTQVYDAQQFSKETLLKVEKKYPRTLCHITISGHSLGAVTAGAQAAALEQDVSLSPFRKLYDFVEFDGIGPHGYIFNGGVADTTVKAVAARTLAFRGNGWGPEALGNMKEAKAHGLPTGLAGTVHIYGNDFGDKNNGAVVKEGWDKTHAMENFTPWVEQVAHDAQKALSITKPDVPKMTKPGRGGPQI